MVADLSLELDLWRQGYRAVAGVDEAGRGACAGPVVAAAVILPPDRSALAPLLGQVDDSKRLTPAARQRLFALICDHAVTIAVGSCAAEVIDRTNILAATVAAMAQAVAGLQPAPDFVLLDYLTVPGLPCAQRGVVHGDAICLSIAAASIVAKVTRDRWMAAEDLRYPGYGFARHKGYGTAEHRAALAQLGACPLHRCSFAPVKAVRGHHG